MKTYLRRDQKNLNKVIRTYRKLNNIYNKKQDLKQKKEIINKYYKNIWSSCNDMWKDNNKQQNLPTFTANEAKIYFTNTYTDNERDYNFTRPDWMPERNNINTGNINRNFNIGKIKKVLKSKSSKSAPGLDNISYRVWKHLEKSLNYLYILYRGVNKLNYIPKSWKVGKLILLYKKGDTNVVKNFRPITLTSTIGKIYTSILGFEIQKFSIRNKIYCNSQKGFLRDKSGCLEHQFLFDYIWDNLKSYKSEVIYVPTDIKNAFGAVKHKLINFTLKYYGFPDWIIQVISSLYSELFITLFYSDSEIIINYLVGVCQGDPASPDIFLLVINLVLVNLLNYKNKGLNLGVKMNNTIVNNTAFADDINLISNNAQNAQILIDKGFKKALDWAKLETQATKLECFGFKKGKFFIPNLTLNDEIIPGPVENEDDNKFRLLGKFWFMMKNKIENNIFIQNILKLKIKNVLEKLDKSLLLLGQKLQVYRLGLKAYLSWYFMIYKINKTFILKEINPMVEKFICKWAGINYINGTKVTIYLKKEHIGLDICNLWTFYKKCQLSKFMILKQSIDLKITKKIFDLELIKYKNKKSKNKMDYKFYGIIIADDYLENYLDNNSNIDIDNSNLELLRSNVVKEFLEDEYKKYLIQANSLKVQTFTFKDLNEKVSVDCWNYSLDSINDILLKFGIKCLTNSLNTDDNLKRWKIISDVNVRMCPLCLKKEATLSHILNNCEFSLNHGRYTFRHNKILELITNFINLNLLKNKYLIYFDLNENYNNNSYFVPNWVLHGYNRNSLFNSDIFNNNNNEIIPQWFFNLEYNDIISENIETFLRPDIIIGDKINDSLFIIELTCPFDRSNNFENAMSRKTAKYNEFTSDCKKSWTKVSFIHIGIGSRGLILKNELEKLHEIEDLCKINIKQLSKSISVMALKMSKWIFDKRKSRD